MSKVIFEHHNPKGQLQKTDMALLQRIITKLQRDCPNLTIGSIKLIKKDGTKKEIQIKDIPEIIKETQDMTRKCECIIKAFLLTYLECKRLCEKLGDNTQ